MTKREELVALVDRISSTPAYTAKDLRTWRTPILERCDQAGDDAVAVILIDVRQRETLANTLRAQASASPPEREAKLRTTRNSIPEDGFNCVYLYENGREVGCLNGPQDDPDVIARAEHWCRLSSRDDGEAKTIHCHCFDDTARKFCLDKNRCQPMAEAQSASTSEAPSTIPADLMSLEVALDFADHPRPHPSIAAPPDTMDELREALTVIAAAYRKGNPIPADVLAMKEACKPFLACLDGYDDSTPDSAVLYTNVDDDGACQLLRTEHFRGLKAAIDRIPVPPSPVQDEAVAIKPKAWIANDPEGGPYLTWSETAARNFPNPIPLYTRPPAKADAGEIDVPGKTAGEPATIKDHPGGSSIWQAFANLYGNGNLDDEDCAYIDRELVAWRGEKFAAPPAPAAEQGVAVKVKPLEWSATRDTGNGDVACDAISSIGHYIACNGGWFLLGQSTWFDTTDLDNAQAAAQADYESRIRSALDIEAQGVAVSVDELRSFIFSEGACTALDLARALLDKYSIRSAMTTEGRK